MFAGDNLLQKPINPHRQKLLAASKRVAKVETGPGVEGPLPKAKSKSKGTAKAKGTPKTKPQAVPKVKAGKASEIKEVQEKAKNDYNGAKKTFLDSFFGYVLGLHLF